MSLEFGVPLIVEDLDITMNCTTYFDPIIRRVILKYKGKTSKRRYSNIMWMARKRSMQRIWKIINEPVTEG